MGIAAVGLKLNENKTKIYMVATNASGIQETIKINRWLSHVTRMIVLNSVPEGRR